VHRADSGPWPRPSGQRGPWRLARRKDVSTSDGWPNPQPKPASAQQNVAHPGSTHDHKVAGSPMPVARGACTHWARSSCPWPARWEAAAWRPTDDKVDGADKSGVGGGGVSAEQGEGPAELTEQHGDGGVAIRGRIGGVRRWQRRSPAGSDPEAAREGKWSGEVQRNRQGK
jgi:hypothetical protein